MPRKVHDFSVKLAANGAEYTSFVQRSPAGLGQARFTPPIERRELEPLRRKLSAAIPASGHLRHMRPASGPDSPYEPEAIGRGLGEGLLTGEVEHLRDRSLGVIQSTGGVLRLSLHLNLADPNVAWLGQLPWELIRDGHHYLLLDPLYSLARCLDLPGVPSPAPMRPPIKVLVVISTPDGAQQLAAKKEYQELKKSFRNNPTVEVKLLGNATPETLGYRVRKEAFHVVHFIGHADFDPANGRGRLVLATAGGAPNPVEADRLAYLLRGEAMPQLLVLNACETASFSWQNGHDPWSGLATALVRFQCPAVVAMQFPITDHAAVAFSRGFYGHLAAGYRVDLAITEGRQAIFLSNHSSLEWATPVLFLGGMEDPAGLLEVETTDVDPPQVGDEKRREAPPARWDWSSVAITLGLGIVGILLAAWLQSESLFHSFTVRRIISVLILSIAFLHFGFVAWIRKQLGPRRVMASLIAYATVLVSFTSIAMSLGPPAACDQVPQVELDLPTAPSLSLNVSGDRITEAREEDLEGIQRLSGRAVFSNPGGHCLCEWSGKTDRDPSMSDLGSSADCAFTIDLPARYDWIYLELKVGEGTYLFTVHVQ